MLVAFLQRNSNTMLKYFPFLLLFFIGADSFGQSNTERNQRRALEQRRRVPSLSFGLHVAEPRNQFRLNFDGVPVGLGGQFMSPLGQSPLEAGFDFSWLSRGSMNEDIWIYEGEDINGEAIYSRGTMEVNSNIFSYNLVGRFKPFAGRIQPYGEVIGGLRHFSTVTVISPNEGEGSETRDRQHGDFALTYGWGAGLKVRVSPAVFVEGRFANLYGSAVDFVDRESIEIGAEGQLNFENISSRTDMYLFQAGVSFEF